MAGVYRKSQIGGFSLMELAIVIVVIGAMLGGLWEAASIVRDHTKQNQMERDVVTTVTNIRNFYAGQAGLPYASLEITTSNMIKNKLIPADLVRLGTGPANGCLDNPGGLCADTVWGAIYDNAGDIDPAGTFRVCSWQLGAVVPAANPKNPPVPMSGCETAIHAGAPAVTQVFAFAIRGLTTKDCIAMVSAMSGDGGAPGLVEFNINGVNMLQTAAVTIHPVDQASAQKWCSTVVSGSAVIRPVYSIRTNGF